MPGRRADLRPKTGKDVPAAAAYNPSHTQVHKATAKFSVGTERRDGSLGIFKGTPGATAYKPHQGSFDTLVRPKSSSWR
jgi:hypothetical protein